MVIRMHSSEYREPSSPSDHFTHRPRGELAKHLMMALSIHNRIHSRSISNREQGRHVKKVIKRVLFGLLCLAAIKVAVALLSPDRTKERNPTPDNAPKVASSELIKYCNDVKTLAGVEIRQRMKGLSYEQAVVWTKDAAGVEPDKEVLKLIRAAHDFDGKFEDFDKLQYAKCINRSQNP